MSHRLAAFLAALPAALLLVPAAPAAAGTVLYSRCADTPRPGACDTSQVWRVEDDGTADRVLTRNECGASSAAWFPNGSRIVYVRLERWPSGECEAAQLWTMNGDGGDHRQLTTRANGSDVNPRVSADNTQIVFASDAATQRFQEKIFVMPSDASAQPRQMTRARSTRDFEPQFTPDGGRIHWTRERVGTGGGSVEQNQLSMRSTDARDVKQLTIGGLPSDAAYSADGLDVAFVWRGALYTVSADGRGLRRLTARVSDAQGPVWSPDLQSLAYTAEADAAPGGGLRNVFRIPARGGPPAVLARASTADEKTTVSDWLMPGVGAPARPAIAYSPGIVVLGSSVAATRGTVSGTRRGLRFLALGSRGIRNVTLAIARRSGSRCRFLGPRRRFGGRRSCSRPPRTAIRRLRRQADFRTLMLSIGRGSYDLRFGATDPDGRGASRAQVVRVRLTR